MAEEVSGFLQNFRRIDGILGSFVLDNRGEIVSIDAEEALKGEACISGMGLMISEICMIARKMGVGDIERHHVAFADKQFMIESLNGGFFLVICMTEDSSSQGRVRLEIRKNKKSLENALAV
ncbi:hypothetical protein IJT10_02560 [bacterium]|nr:hypothetical protein [bacterium]